MDNQVSEYATKVLNLARDTITVRFRFFDAPLMKIKYKEAAEIGGFMSNDDTLFYNPQTLLLKFKDEPNYAVRLILHVLLHKIFLHPYRFDKENENYWNLATDIFVENLILDMDIAGLSMTTDGEKREIIKKIQKWVPSLSAEKIYREFAMGGLSEESESKYKRLFTMDTHSPRVTYREEPETIISEEDWKKITERVKTEIEDFSEKGALGESLIEHLKKAVRPKYDFDSILRKFTTLSEEIKINPDEFDINFYTYGLNLYGKMPLIEPLEYVEEKRIRDFVIVLDTSASCNEKGVRKFLEHTVNIISDSSAFASKVNIHILQCDAKVWSDTKVTDLTTVDEVFDNIKVSGFGATDFRPAFRYVDELIKSKELTRLKGVIYFTDGAGIYPDKAPDYDVLFAFIGEDETRPKVPDWAIKVILEETI